MEIMRDTVSSVNFRLPTDDTEFIGATYSLNDAEAKPLSTTTTNGVVSARLPYLQSEGDLRVTWSFEIDDTEYNKTYTHKVVTPLLSDEEIREIIGDEATDLEVRRAEAGVRHIISSHTGQNFGKFVGKISVSGSGEGDLRLPRRLISFNSINDEAAWVGFLALRGGGWFLQSRYPVGPPPIRADYHGWHYNPNSGVITAPPLYHRGQFIAHQEYVIDGVWGYDEVPDAVREAARLLINDYACGDSLYRDRFLTSMTAADWRIQFHDGAFANTGNVRANQLLGEFVRPRGWVVV